MNAEEEEPATNEEYIARVIRQSKQHEQEKVQSHTEILLDHDTLKDSYTQKLEITLGVIIVLIIAFFAIKTFSIDL